MVKLPDQYVKALYYMSTTKRRRLEAQLANRKQGSLAQVLFQAARIYNEHAVARIKTRVPEARTSHTRLLPYIDLQGTRQSELARRAGISKQAVGQLVDDLVRFGVLERTPDPSDGRAQLVCFTDPGLEQLIAGFDVLDGIERELSGRLGERSVRTLQTELQQLLVALQALA
ncbi:MAG: MarR family transcriptional regulator [Polyangiales bacterium]